MKGSAKVIDLLNEILTAELTAINQYFIHAKMCQNWGYDRLYRKIREESIDEMKHADQLIERILFLDGVPNVQRYGKVTVGETVPEQIDLDLAVEYAAVDRLRKAIATCREEGDEATAEMLEHILVSEEEHVDWLETQKSLIDQVGLQNYLAEQMHA
ncbi:MAG: bacterioferritin [Deltaproteobacteria bacterium]|nr:MAG: bacterioferritin [Deltaproteobacteria bacterium]